MSVSELEVAVSKLDKEDLELFNAWYEEFVAEQWDRRIEADITAGKFDKIFAQADAAYNAGECAKL